MKSKRMYWIIRKIEQEDEEQKKEYENEVAVQREFENRVIDSR